VRIYLQRALTIEDAATAPCVLCGSRFEPQGIIALLGEHGGEICPACLLALLERKDRGSEVAAKWQTLEEYLVALERHPEPVTTREEARRAEELGMYDDLLTLTDIDL
jgi:hypothetical protein